MTRLEVVPEPALVEAVTDGLGRDPAGEDRFDCLLGVLCVINVSGGHRPDDDAGRSLADDVGGLGAWADGAAGGAGGG